MNPPADLLTPTTDALRVPREALEARVARRLTARLHDATDALPHDVTERLRYARELAVAQAQHQRRLAQAASSAEVVVGMGRQASLAGPPAWGLRLASLLPLVVLVLGLSLIQQHVQDEQIQVAADIDSALLADELPPGAYTDPGFQEYLRLQGGR